MLKEPKRIIAEEPRTPEYSLLTKLIDANKKIATLEGLSSRIPNMGLFVSMYVRKEALLSSQIEGTQCTLEDILNPLIEENTNRDVSDVVNYIRATEFAFERLKTLPLCNRLIKETHAVLLESVRGQEKNPGEFRYSTCWTTSYYTLPNGKRYSVYSGTLYFLLPQDEPFRIL